MTTRIHHSYRPLVKAALKAGWELSMTGHNHYRLKPPDKGRPLYFPLTPSEPRGWKNFRAALRRGGVKC